MPERKHLVALDGLRGCAILAVLLHHCLPAIGPYPMRKMLEVALTPCWSGVDLFFVLSGFLITGILWDSRRDPHYFRNFYMRRTLRIFPLYYGFLACFFGVLIPLFPSLDPHRYLAAHQGWVWFYGTNLFEIICGQFTLVYLLHFWSLAIEEHFYLVWPSVVRRCGEESLKRVCAAVMGGAFLLRWVLYLETGTASWMVNYVFTLSRMDDLALGALIAMAYRDGTLYRLARSPLLNRLWLGSGVFLLALLLSSNRWNRTTWVFQTLGYTAIGLWYGLLLARVLTASPEGWLSRAASHPVLTFFGRYSYGIYVFHYPLKVVLDTVWPGPSEPGYVASLWRMATFFGVTVGATVALAVASFHLYEKPFLRLKRFFESERTAPY